MVASGHETDRCGRHRPWNGHRRAWVWSRRPLSDTERQALAAKGILVLGPDDATTDRRDLTTLRDYGRSVVMMTIGRDRWLNLAGRGWMFYQPNDKT